MKFKGVGEAKAVSIVAALELGRRRKSQEIITKTIINSAYIAYEIVKGDLIDLGFEEFWILLMKQNKEFIKKVKISSGGVAGTVVDPKIIFKYALEASASFLILIHNHPSGNLNPSTQDIRITRQLVDAGKAIEIGVVDHLIVTDRGYYSFNEEGQI